MDNFNFSVLPLSRQLVVNCLGPNPGRRKLQLDKKIVWACFKYFHEFDRCEVLLASLALCGGNIQYLDNKPQMV